MTQWSFSADSHATVHVDIDVGGGNAATVALMSIDQSTRRLVDRPYIADRWWTNVATSVAAHFDAFDPPLIAR